MSSTLDLVAALKAELKAVGWTYADVSQALGMAESSIKRMFAKGDMPLSRIDEICRAIKLDFADLARKVADDRSPQSMLSLEAEQALSHDSGLMLVGLCVVSQWTFEQIVATYELSEAECVKHMVMLDKLGIIELRPHNRYRVKLAKTFRWQPKGPVMSYFREHLVQDYFSGHFDGESETLMMVHGSIGKSVATGFTERLHRVAQDFAQQHHADQRQGTERRAGYTLLLAMRRWEVAAFRGMRRPHGVK